MALDRIGEKNLEASGIVCRIMATASTTEPIEGKGQHVRRMFTSIAPRYDFLNHFLSLNIDRRWRRFLVRALQLPPGAQVLDLCTGTGDLALELFRAMSADPAARVFGADFVPDMLLRAHAKAERQRAPLRWVGADTLQLPFGDRCFDAATVAFGVRNLEDLHRGLHEMARVLKPRGKVAIPEFSDPTWPFLRRLYRFYFHHVLPRIGGWVSGSRSSYTYLPRSVDSFPSRDVLSRLLEECGFEAVEFLSRSCGIVTVHFGVRQ